MTKLKLIFLIFTIYLIESSDTTGQGCSDAGFCTINSFKPNGSNPTSLKNQIKLGAFIGKADHSISVSGAYLEYNKQVNQKIGLDVKLTSISQSGNGISVFGLSDIFVNANYNASDKVKFSIGSKIPLSDGNKTQKNIPLPMDYQSSLGTFDLIIGIATTIKDVQIVAAIQQPLTQNKNGFLSLYYPLDSQLYNFQSTNQFERSGDILMRISYPILINPKFKLTPSLLPIYHLKNDQYTDETLIKREIVGSQGLTVNGNVYLDYDMNTKSSIQLNAGIPLKVRDARPDGLTRSAIISFEFRTKF